MYAVNIKSELHTDNGMKCLYGNRVTEFNLIFQQLQGTVLDNMPTSEI
jgi:hypothetical protein